MLGTGVVIKVALSVAMASGASVGAAAYAGALPWGAQHAAGHRHAQHANAHSQHKREHGHGAPVGPDATGPAAHGLCSAYSHQHARGKAMGHSIAVRNLARAAGGAARITGYCAMVR